MFENYDQKARQVIFFAQYEATHCGSHYVKPEHLLLGLIRADKDLARRMFPGESTSNKIRKTVLARTEVGKKISTLIELPFSEESLQSLNLAAEESQLLSRKKVGPEDILLGLLRCQKSLAAEILQERGLKVESVREEVNKRRIEP
jgi:ATP-dependent Clp protease ATP-binding subunit ClpC